MKIILTLSLFFVVICAYVVFKAIGMSKNNELKNEDCSVEGVCSIVHLNASKTVIDSMEGAKKTLDDFGVHDFSLSHFLDSLNGG